VKTARGSGPFSLMGLAAAFVSTPFTD